MQHDTYYQPLLMQQHQQEDAQHNGCYDEHPDGEYHDSYSNSMQFSDLGYRPAQQHGEQPVPVRRGSYQPPDDSYYEELQEPRWMQHLHF